MPPKKMQNPKNEIAIRHENADGSPAGETIVVVVKRHDPNEELLTCDEIRRQNARNFRAIVAGTADYEEVLRLSIVAKIDLAALALKMKAMQSAGLRHTPDTLKFAGIKIEQIEKKESNV